MATETKMQRKSELRWVKVGELEVSTNAQRPFVAGWATAIASGFDPDEFGIPLVNVRDGRMWVVDGQHRVAAMRLMGWEDQLIECECHEGLSVKEEAALFLARNRTRAIKPLDKFLVGVTAQEIRVLAIARVVAAEGLAIGGHKPAIAAVSALGKVYSRGGADALGAALRIIRDAYGERAFDGNLIEGVGLVTHRYDGTLDEAVAVEKLGKIHGGVGGLIKGAAVIRHATGRSVPECIAVAVVDAINSGRGSKGKIPGWWS